MHDKSQLSFELSYSKNSEGSNASYDGVSVGAQSTAQDAENPLDDISRSSSQITRTFSPVDGVESQFGGTQYDDNGITEQLDHNGVKVDLDHHLGATAVPVLPEDSEKKALDKLVQKIGSLRAISDSKIRDVDDDQVSSDDDDGNDSDAEEADDEMTNGTSCFCFKPRCCCCCRDVPFCTYFAQHPGATLSLLVGIVFLTVGLFLDFYEPVSVDEVSLFLKFLGSTLIAYFMGNAMYHMLNAFLSWRLSVEAKARSRESKRRYYLELSVFYSTGLSSTLPRVLWGLWTMLFWYAVFQVSVDPGDHGYAQIAFYVVSVLMLLFLAHMCAKLVRMFIVQDFGTRSYRDRVIRTVGYEYFLRGFAGNPSNQFEAIDLQFADIPEGGDINPELWQIAQVYLQGHHVTGIQVPGGVFKPAQGREPDFRRHSNRVSRALFESLWNRATLLRASQIGDSSLASCDKGTLPRVPEHSTQEQERELLPRVAWTLNSDSVSASHDRRIIYRHELRQIFAQLGMRRADELETLFDVYLDPNRKGYTRLARFRKTVDYMVRDRYSLAVTMLDAATVMHSMENIFFLGFLLIVIIITFAMTSSAQSVGTSIASLVSIVVAWSFVFGSSMKANFEGFVFLFSIHLYDVGDLVRFDDNLLRVSRMRVLTTDFIRDDGAFIRLENVVLRGKTIINLTTSKSYAQLINFYVRAHEMNPRILAGLEKDIASFVLANSSDYGSFHLTMREFVHGVRTGSDDNGNFVRMAVWLNFKKMNYELLPCHMARQHFIMHVCTLLQKYDIGRGAESKKRDREIIWLDKKISDAEKLALSL